MKNIKITARDLAVMTDLGEYGVLDLKMIHGLRFADVTQRRCLQRLTQLADHGYIRRTRLRVWYDDASRSGKIPTIYSLTDRGAELLSELNGETPKRILRSAPKPETLFHRIQIVRWRLAFDAAFRLDSLPQPRWVMEQDCRSDVSEKAPPNQRSVLYHRYSVGGNPVSCKPDAASLFTIPDKNGAMVPIIFYWEIDRSTEGHEQIKSQKIRGYTELLKHSPYLRYWSDCINPAIRIVFACKHDLQERRANNLARTFSTTSLNRHVRFVSAQDCEPTKLLRDFVWADTSGIKKRIING